MRAINWDEPLTDDDKLWLEQRMTPELAAKIEANEAKFADAGSEKNDGNDDTFSDDYDSWKLAELKEEAGNREGLDASGLKTKPEFIAALRTWDAAHPE